MPRDEGQVAIPHWYPDFVSSMADRISGARRRAVVAANTELVGTYWAVGCEILALQNAEGWGAKAIDRLSANLWQLLPDASGFSARNLKYMRAFDAAWPDTEIVQGNLARLPRYYHNALIEKLHNSEQRLWYAEMALDQSWSRDVLVNHIEGGLHQRAGRAITNFVATLPPADSDLAQQSTRGPYLFAFVGNADIRLERDVEWALTVHVENPCSNSITASRSLDVRFALRSVTRTTISTCSSYLRLRCYVVIELKVGNFEPGYISQLGTYMAAVDDTFRYHDDKLTIGLLLCRTKSNVVTEYALRGFTMPIGVAAWTTTITESLPTELESSLPSIEQLEAELGENEGET